MVMIEEALGGASGEEERKVKGFDGGKPALRFGALFIEFAHFS
jgi:hypothetical protein